jgi:putative aldouronate transport system substrate-binding protein
MEYYNGQTEYLKGVLDAYGILGLNEMFPKGYQYVLDLPVLLRGPVHNLAIGGTERTAVIFENYKELIQSRSAKTIMAAPEQFDAEWDSFMNELERIGMPELEQEVTGLLRERYDLWYN